MSVYTTCFFCLMVQIHSLPVLLKLNETHEVFSVSWNGMLDHIGKYADMSGMFWRSESNTAAVIVSTQPPTDVIIWNLCEN